MNDLKLDLLNKFYQNKYFAELEIVRLSGIDQTMEYRLILHKISEQLDIMNTAEARIELIKKLYADSETNEQINNENKL